MATNDPKKHLIEKLLIYRNGLRSTPARNFKFQDATRQNNSNAELSLKKGTDFESFIVRRFDPKYFTLIEWRSDKCVDGVFPLMSKFPDLEFYFNTQAEKCYFAIECKWRESFQQETIRLDKFQVQNYRSYQTATGNRTFLAIGVGNTPSNPNQVYIIPLEDIEHEVLHEFSLNVYRRSSTHGMFFFDASSGFLK